MADEYLDELDDDATLGGDTLVALSSTAQNGTELSQDMNKRLKPADELQQEADTFMSKIKESKVAGNIARKEREKRRRRFLVDLHNQHEKDVEEYLMGHFTQNLTKPSLEEERMNYVVWKAGTYEQVMRNNRQLRTDQYDSKRREDKDFEKNMDLELRDSLVEELYCVSQISDAKYYRALERGRVARRRAYHTNLMEHLVKDAFVDAMFFAKQQQQISDKEECDDRTWKLIMEKFIEQEKITMDSDPANHKCYEITFKQPEEDQLAAESTQNELVTYLHQQEQWQFEKKDEESLVWLEGEKRECGEFIEELTATAQVADDGRWTNFRMGAILREVLTLLYPEPGQLVPPEDKLPDVPLKVVLSGKPLCGKKTILEVEKII